ncbi:MAG: AAA family ATPase [Planctomycetia bacterium]|nr:AAA family ATPase [Planctomycetia bacterium]
MMRTQPVNGRYRMTRADGPQDRPAPVDLDAERGCLGSILLDGKRLPEVAGIVGPDDFFVERHQRLFGHLAGMHAVGITPDLVLLLDRLRQSGDLAEIGGEAYLAELAKSVAVAGHAAKYAGIVKRKSQQRAIIAAAQQAMTRALDDEGEPAATVTTLGETLAERVIGRRQERFASELFTGKQLLGLDLSTDYLVYGVLAKGQPCVVGGRSKSLKTSIAIDLVLSLGSGTRFLGQFHAECVNCGFWSGESGAATIRETAKRVAEAKGVDLRNASVVWSFELPKLGELDQVAALGELIAERHLDVVVIDPLYLSLLSARTASGASNLFAMGATLAPLSALAQTTGCTPILLHHFRKNSAVDDDEPAGLAELSQAGIGEWARQWILLQRRSAYQHDGTHELYMRTGGSASHAGLWGVDVAEGVIPSRYWDVKVQPIANAREESRRAAEQRKAVALQRKEDEQRQRLHAAMRQFADGETAKTLRAASGLNINAFGRAVDVLIQRGEAEPCENQKRQKHDRKREN